MEWPSDNYASKRIENSEMGSFIEKIKSSWQPLLIFLLLSLGIIVIGWLYSRYHLKEHYSDISRDLESVASLKQNQINNWLSERIADAQNIIDNPYIGERISQLFREKGSQIIDSDRLKWMSSMKDLRQYQNILLLDTSGLIRMQIGKTVHRIGPETADLVGKVVAGRRASFSDFYYCTECKAPHLDVFAPIIHYNNKKDSVVAVIILRIEPEHLLYPLIQQWPVPSKSAETYLVRREGSNVLYLTELRFQKDSAVKLSNPLSKENLPEVMAINGRIGNVRAVDYQGKNVYAFLNNIPNSPWFIIAKTDSKEVNAIAYLHIWLIAVIAIVMIIAAGGVIGFLWNRQQNKYYRKQLELVEERQALNKHYEYLTKYANDIILLLDEALYIKEANDKAVAAYGYSREKLLTLNIHNLRETGSRSSIDDQYRKVVDENGLLFETIHYRHDQSAFPVEVSARMIEAENRKYFQLIIRDITERKHDQEVLEAQKEELEAANQELLIANRKFVNSEQELKQADEDLKAQLVEAQNSHIALQKSQDSLRQNEKFIQSIIKHSPIGIAVRNKNGKLLSYNEAWVKIWGMDEERISRHIQDIIGDRFNELFEHLGPHLGDVKKIFTNGGSLFIPELNIVKPNPGGATWVRQYFYTVNDPLGRIDNIVILTDDITDRKQADEELRKTHHELTSNYEKLSSINKELKLSQEELQAAKLELKGNLDVIKKSEKQLKISLAEKEVLLKEVHHRVKNNLQIINSLLNLQTDFVKDETYKRMFRESQSRVRSMALVHEKLYKSQNLASVDFSEYVAGLVNELYKTFGVTQKEIGLSINITQKEVPVDIAIPCGLIINELVSNSLKHAFWDVKTPKAIDITMHHNDEGRYTLTVSDNGSGVKGNVDLQTAPTLGFQLIWALKDQLNGQISVNGEKGTTFRIAFSA
jgi:PAS domain S-box-containing protein